MVVISPKLNNTFNEKSLNNDIINSRLRTLNELWIQDKYKEQIIKILESAWTNINNPIFVDAFDSLVNWVKWLDNKKHELIINAIWWVADDYEEQQVA